MATVRQPISRLPLVSEIGMDALFPILENPDSEDKRTVAATLLTVLEATAQSILFGIAIRIALYAQGVIAGLLLRLQLPEPFVIAPNFPSSIATSGSPATDETVITIEKEGLEIGTITFAAASSEGIFAGSGGEFAAEEVLTITGPMVQDGSLDQVAITIAAGRIET
jgi:hypothetical protein